MQLGDYGTLANSLFTHATPPTPAVASFELRWMGNNGSTGTVTDSGTNHFTYSGIYTHATLEWSASVPGKNFRFQSDPASTSHETFAELVNERNGSFFSADDD